MQPRRNVFMRRLATLLLPVVLIGLIEPVVFASSAGANQRIMLPLVAGMAAPSVISATHPRLLLTPAKKTQLLAKKNANDPAWLALKARADVLATYSVYRYTYDTRFDEPDNTIFYDYQGQGWFDAALPLAFAYQMTGSTKYSNKLLALADEMLRAQSDPANNPPRGQPPLRPDDYYPTRYLGPVLAIIYDWCYDRLGATRKARMVALMNTYFDDMRANAYQVNDSPDGNYFPSHMVAAADMGYASFGDNPRAQALIDWARIRFDGTPSSLVAPGNVPAEHVTQVFDGGIKPMIARDYNGPNIKGAPWRGGFDAQGWSYGTTTLNELIDYMQVVRSATGEDLLKAHATWFPQIYRALKQGLMPDQFKILPDGDWGSDYGAVINRSLPVRLAAVLAGTADGPGAQHFAYTEIPAHSPYPAFPDYIYQEVRQQAAWEEFFFGDRTRPATAQTLPPYYSGFAPAASAGGSTNGAIPYFYLRSNWSTSATWAFLHLGAAWYNDHQHTDAGNLILTHGADQLLVDASNWKGSARSTGIVGSSYDETSGHAGAANTLWFDDFGDFQRSALDSEYYAGGQGIWGKDEVSAAEQTAAFSYLRSNLTSAYNRSSDPADQVGRKLGFFARSVVYLRPADVFVVYDQVRAVASTNPLGQYRKHLRWHFPNVPTITGNLVRVDQGASRLYVQTLLPAAVGIVAVNEANNPDPCEGRPASCTPYGEAANSGTWRIEVRDRNNPLSTPFLTVLQAGPKTRAPMTSSTLGTRDGKMVGARITQSSGMTSLVNIVLVNSQAVAAPAPITTTSYAFAGPATALHTLCGMTPRAHFRATLVNGIVTVVQSTTGPLQASPAGVLQFKL